MKYWHCCRPLKAGSAAGRRFCPQPSRGIQSNWKTAIHTYYLVETAPPSGFKQLTGQTPVTITEGNVLANDIIEATVYNYLDNGFSLPSTGGPGTMLFIAGGLVLIGAAGLLFMLWARRRRSK